jgi:hypothetical protein
MCIPVNVTCSRASLKGSAAHRLKAPPPTRSRPYIVISVRSILGL